MGAWFTVEEIDTETFAISEYGHWEESHSYLLCGNGKAILIDTGLGVGDLLGTARQLTRFPIEVLTTHAHWDHIGSHGQFLQIAVHPAELDWVSGKFPLPLEAVKRNLMRQACDFPARFDASEYSLYDAGASRLLHDGEYIEFGGRSVEVLHTPGHSPGHCCFYEADRGYLYAGDLIYRGCLDAFYPTTDPYCFWKSVQKIQRFAVNRVLPGHHTLEVPVPLIGQIEKAFAQLFARGELVQGNGIYPFEGFAIHI